MGSIRTVPEGVREVRYYGYQYVHRLGRVIYINSPAPDIAAVAKKVINYYQGQKLVSPLEKAL